jgi:hypothetical protein
MQKGPRFIIARNAYRYIHDASFDADLFTKYLDARKIPEEEAAALHVTIDDKYMSFGAHGIFIARDTNDKDSMHTIGFSPSRMPISLHNQGKILRHETEHFVYHTKYPNHLRNRKILVAGAVASVACISAKLGVEMGINLDSNLPLAAQIPIDTVSGLGVAAFGSVATLIPAVMGHTVFGPSELQSEWAEYRRKLELPDGVLQIAFA